MRGLPNEIIASEAFGFRTRPIRWKRSTGHFVDSHCGFWHITPIYGGLCNPESYELWFGAESRRRVGSGQTQRECKVTAKDMTHASKEKP